MIDAASPAIRRPLGAATFKLVNERLSFRLMGIPQYFPATYAAGRRAFLEAARAADFTLKAYRGLTSS